MIEGVAQVALTVGFGALAGGITNTLAIWMLFHPYEAPRLFGRPIRSLQGAIPKNKARLASAIGRTVGTRLLTPEDLALTLTNPRLRSAFDERVHSLFERLLEEDWGPLSESISPDLRTELQRVLDEVIELLIGRLDRYMASPAFHAVVERRVEELVRELEGRPIGELLTPAWESALTDAAARWISSGLEGPAFERAVRRYLDTLIARALVPGRSFQDLLPARLVTTLEKAIASYLPIVLERLGTLLEDPEIRALVQRALGEVLERFMRDLKFHKRLVASLLINSETVDKVLKAVEDEGTGKISEILHEPATRAAMARGVNDAVIEFLQRPIESVLGRPDDPNVREAGTAVGDWILSLARDPRTERFITGRIQALLRTTGHRNWGEVLEQVPTERLTDLIVAALRSERARSIYHETATELRSRILERPLGRPADLLPEGSTSRIEGLIAEPLWLWIQQQVPQIAGQIDIESQIEAKILDFPMERVEELIRSVTERELYLIVRLGYLLGGVIGLISAALALLLG